VPQGRQELFRNRSKDWGWENRPGTICWSRRESVKRDGRDGSDGRDGRDGRGMGGLTRMRDVGGMVWEG